jgi:hypothetical protein
MHNTNVNASALHPQAAAWPATSTLTEGVRRQSHDIEGQIFDAKILIEAIFNEIDGMHDLSPSALHRVNVINCFATCALRNLNLVAAANNNVLLMTATGDAA